MSILIAGGGLSGLSLAAQLAAEPGVDDPVTVVDDGSRRIDTMVWSSWADRPSLLDAAVSRRFDRVRVHAAGQTRTLGLGRYHYQVARGEDLEQVVRRMLEPLPRFSFRHGHVDGIAGDGQVVVDGEPVFARWVFDSVLGAPDRPPVDAHLAFRGWRVRTERSLFDPGTPTLFDFRTAQTDAAAFVYALPASEHEALIEHTAFTAPGTTLDAATQRAALSEYLEHVLRAESHVVLHEEAATLPLSARTVERRRGDVLTIGTEAGMVKASTGYAYQRVQRDSAAIARSLACHGHPFDLPQPHARHRLFDGALLEVVTRDPAELERAFVALFRGSSAEPALRFLDERTSIAEETRLFAGMRAGVYLGAVGRRLRA